MSTDISTLFARSPLDRSYTDEELTAVVAAFREARHRFVTQPTKTKAPAPLKTEDARRIADILNDIDIDL